MKYLWSVSFCLPISTQFFLVNVLLLSLWRNFCSFLFYLTNSIDICLTYFVHTGPSRIPKFGDSLSAGRSGDRIPFGGEIFRTRSTQPWGPPSRGVHPAVRPTQPLGPPSRGAHPAVRPTQALGPPSRWTHPAVGLTQPWGPPNRLHNGSEAARAWCHRPSPLQVRG